MADHSNAALLHRDALVIDSHNDAIVNHIRRGNLGFSGSPPPDGDRRNATVAGLRGLLDRPSLETPVQIDFPKMRKGGLDAAFFAVDVTLAVKNHLTYALDAMGFFDSELEAHGDDVVLAKTAGDIVRAKQDGKLAVILAIENSDGVEGSINVLRMLHRVGVRSIGLTHDVGSLAAHGNAEARSRGGLTRFGVRLVEEMNNLGMLVDVSHVSETGFWDVMEVSQKPVIASHSNCKALCDHPRNLSNEQIRALAKNGGSMGVTFVPRFVDKSAPTFARLLDHVDHIVQLVGAEHAGVGSDFDGGGTLLDDATSFPRITLGLLDRGYSEADVRKILGENHLRVFSEVTGN